MADEQELQAQLKNRINNLSQMHEAMSNMLSDDADPFLSFYLLSQDIADQAEYYTDRAGMLELLAAYQAAAAEILQENGIDPFNPLG